jgi:putative membrane protein
MKKININELIWFIILASFAYYIYGLFNTQKINTYMHPKMFKYVLFSLGVFILLSIFQFRRIFIYEQNKRIKPGYIIFIIPLLLAFIVNPENLSAKVVSNKNINIVNSNLDNKEKPAIDDEEIQLDMNIDTSADYYSAHGEKFKDTMMILYENLDEMIDEEVELSGFVYRESDFSEERFVIARLLMSCCAADAQVAGLLCEWDGDNKPQDNEWIKIMGRVESTIYYNEYTHEEGEVALIKITKVEVIEPPKDQYIYP